MKKYQGTNVLKDVEKLHSQKSMKKVKEKSPFKNYGAGILSYFNLMENLILTFLLLCIVMVPTMVIYASDEGYVGKVADSQKFFALMTLGNLGHVSSQCIH
jgi:hypothetical protein